MNKFFESIKDFLYDSVDYLIMIVIIAIVTLVIGWRVNILFVDKAADNPIASIEQSGDDIVDEVSDRNSDREEDGEIVNVNIPEGSLPATIGDILEEHELVSSSEEFISKSEDMKLDTKLQSGNFDIELGSSLEDIIHIIAK